MALIWLLRFSFLMGDGDKTVFTVEDDGVLSGPPNGLMTRLTKLK